MLVAEASGFNHLLQKYAAKNEVVKKAITQDEVTGLTNMQIFFLKKTRFQCAATDTGWFICTL